MFTKVIGKTNEPGDSGSEAPIPANQPQRPPAPGPAPSATAVHPAASPTLAAGARNILSSDVEIKGSVKFTNDLLVDGRIEGEIISDGNLTVGENAKLKAEIHTSSVIIHGKVHGNITVTDRVELRAGSEVVGDIKAQTLSVEAGAIFVGKSEVGTPSTVSASQPAQAKPADREDKPAAAQGQKPGAPNPQQGPSKNVPSGPPKQGTLAGTDT